MYTYITFFNLGEDSEALLLDHFPDNMGDLIVWESREAYFAARATEPDPIDGGVYSYWLAAATSMAPNDMIRDRIVSYLAPESLVGLLGILHSTVRAMRTAEWPEWPED